MSMPNQSPAMSSGRRRTKASSLDASVETHNQFDGQTNQLQRLFTEEDEFNLLTCYFQITRSADPTKNSQPTLDSSTLDRIETTLGFKFSNTQIVDKLRRLRLKYHKLARTKSLIKTPHDREIYEIGRKIWGKGSSSRKRSEGIRITDSGNKKETSETPGEVLITRNEEVNLKNFPVLVNELSQRFPGNVVWKAGLRALEQRSLMGMNDKWILLLIEEAELKARRAALVQKQVKAALEAVVSNRITDISEVVNYNTR